MPPSKAHPRQRCIDPNFTKKDTRKASSDCTLTHSEPSPFQSSHKCHSTENTALPFLFLCLALWIHFSPLFIPLGPETFSTVSLLRTSFSRLFQDKGWPGYNPAIRSAQPQASFPNEVKRSAAAKKNTASQLLPRAVNILIRIISKLRSHGKP